MRVSYDPASGRVRAVGDEPAAPTPAPSPTVVGAKTFAPPAMRHRDVSLRPIRTADYEFLRLVETTGELAARWRFRGSTPGPEQWAQRTWAGVLAQYLVFTNAEGPPVGIVSCYEHDLEHGHAKLAAARFDPGAQSTAMVVGLALLVRHVFASWDLRKLYMDVPEYNLPQFQSVIGRIFREEGRLVDHLYFGGERWDQLILALHRPDWAAVEARLLRP